MSSAPSLTVDALRRRGFAVPHLAAPRYHYRHAVVWGSVAHLSGKLPIDGDGRAPYRGRVGAEVSPDEAREAARLCALQLVAAVEDAVGLPRLERFLRVTGYVMTAPGFTAPGTVVDAASELLTDALGERGWHARTALGVAQLPDDVPVELDAVVAVRNGH